MEKLLTLGSKFMKNKERMVARLLQKLEKKKTENGTCQADKKKKAVELARIQNKHKKIKVALKKESDAWKEEINTLTAQLFGHRAICNYVRNNTIAVKLCTRKLLDPALKKEPRRNKP
ncbi:hypothetical protein EPR50_G00147850 [Scomber scombrus]|uniref:Uncharacterized protein n=1 Tax=Scomber scombrus TaxID=13677 RepID=A0AAV1MRE2_SCOSC